MAVACRYLSPACLASSSHLVPAARAALAVTDTCMVRRRVQYGTGSVCGNRARNVGIVRKSCRGEQHARPARAPLPTQEPRESLPVHTGLASQCAAATRGQRGPRVPGARSAGARGAVARRRRARSQASAVAGYTSGHRLSSLVSNSSGHGRAGGCGVCRHPASTVRAPRDAGTDVARGAAWH
jgi:hypothetical protein